MQILYGQNTASNILLTAQKRLIRPAYAQTQGFPYAAYLDPSLRNTDNSIRIPLGADTAAAVAGQGHVPLTRAAAPGGTAYTYQGSLIPGLVMVKTASENAAVSNAAASIQPWGLLAQWVGGMFDNIGQNNQIGLWMGPDSVYELIAPAWDDTAVASSVASATAGAPVLLYSGPDGRLTSTNGGSQVAVARVLDRPSSARLLIQLLI